MHIRELEIDNFKSFAQKVTIPFLDGFTTISGPNGSGKSNIIDSILFGLGLSSSRALRAERLHHLISTHNQRNEASVKISFADDNDNKLMTVERRIRKAPSGFLSTYYADGKTSSLTEIHEKLSKFNISPGSYNVIMQGDVTTITNSSPLERRRILDEIAGVADFDRRIEQATKELETVEARVERSSIVLNEIEIRIDQLKSQREQAIKYQKIRDEKQDLESKISTIKYFDIKNSLERLHENILETNKEKKHKEKEQEKLNEALEATKEKLKEISELVKQKGEDEQLKIKAQAEAMKSDIATKKNTIEYIEKQIDNNKISAKNAQENIVHLKEKIDDAKLRIDNKNDEIKSVEKNIEHEKEELETILKDISEISKESNENVKRRNELRLQLENKKDEETSVIQQLAPKEESLKTIEKQVSEAKLAISSYEETRQANLEEKDKFDLQIEELTKELKDYEMMQRNALAEQDRFKVDLDTISRDIQLAYMKVAQLEANKRASEEANFGRAVDTIMKSNLEGVHAPLAKLGKVNQDYSTALEVAMGGRMAFVVVDDDEVGSTAIEILKSSNAGRATFLPLNKLKSSPRNLRTPNERGIIDYAINLIDFEETYRDAFFLAVGETLVVEDMATARKYLGKYRMVTLDGSLLEKSGSMSGGSTSRNSLKFSNTEDNELNHCKSKLVEFENNYKRIEAKRNELDKKLSSIRQEYSSTMTELNKKKMASDNLVTNMSNQEKQLEVKQVFIDENEPKVLELKAKIADFIKKQEIIKVEKEKLLVEIEKIEQTIPEDELSKLNEKSESIEFQIRKFQTDILNAQGDIKTIHAEIGFIEQSIGAQKERITKLESDNENFLKDKELNIQQISQIEEKLVELNEKIKEIGSKLTELQAQRDEIQNAVLDTQNAKNTLELNIERINESIEAFKTRRRELEPQFETIREELLEAGYQVANLQPLDISTEEVMKTIARLDKRMEELGDVNMMAIKEYDEVSERKDELKTKLNTLSLEKGQILDRMRSYEDLKRQTFLETFEKINFNFQDIFADLSDGTGKLVLERPDDPLSGGLTIEAQPRDKKMQRLESMSGGEKSLTALAFVFAIQRYMPAPFYAFDEVDMHLDGINVEKLSDMIRKQSKNTQFIVVSLRKPMIESANRTIGVTQKDSGVTKVTGIKLGE